MSAKALFEKAGLDPKKHPEIFRRTEKILGETQAFWHVAYAMKDITGEQLVKKYASQERSLLKELKRFKANGEVLDGRPWKDARKKKVRQ